MEKVAVEPSCWSSSYTYQVSKHSAEMLHNLNVQRKDGGRFCDVVLRVGEESFPAHRAVLAACSEYFESVFSCQAAEEEEEHERRRRGGGGGGGDGSGGDATAANNNNNKELEMHTISPKVFRDILDFAYTSRIVVRLECFPELMTAAKFLLMRSVVEICQEVIKQSNVQILVPTARGADASLFQAATSGTGGGSGSSSSDHPGFNNQQQQQQQHQDHVMVNGTGMLVNGMPSFANNNGQTHMEQNADAVLLEDEEGSMPVLQPVDGLPLPGQEEEDEEEEEGFHDSGSSPGSKRNNNTRGRPKKGNNMEPLHFNHSTPIKDNNALLFPCRTCGKAFTEPQRLKNHEAQHGAGTVPTAEGGITLLSHHQQHPQAGLLVENGAGVPPLLLDHNNSRKRERTRRHVGCEICGKVFRDVYHLNRHKLSHSGEKPYACHVCGLRFKRKDRMSYHVRSHDGSVGKPYVCQSCGKGFSRPDHLNGHIKQVHTTERPHKCQICNASFATRDRLRSHLACHEDKIPCKICGKFLRAAYMTDHLKKHSEGNHNYCGICNKGFSTASYLKVHIKAHHSSPLPPHPATMHVFPESRGGTQTHNGAPYHTGRQCSVEDLCSSHHQLLVTFPEAAAEGRFLSRLSGPPVLPQPPGPPPPAPSLGPQGPEGPPPLLGGKSGGGGAAPYFWEWRSAGAPGFPFHGPLADGQENAGKCPHLESEESDPSFGELSNGSELKSPHKADGGEEMEMSSLACNGPSAAALSSPEGSNKAKTTDPEKKFTCGICGQAFRTKSYLNKHQHRVHKAQRGQGGTGGSGLGELAPALSSPFSPQQNMSLLESFGFQIVQSAFAASLVDPEAGQSGMDFGGK